jgi:hypothetical protein
MVSTSSELRIGGGRSRNQGRRQSGTVRVGPGTRRLAWIHTAQPTDAQKQCKGKAGPEFTGWVGEVVGSVRCGWNAVGRAKCSGVDQARWVGGSNRFPTFYNLTRQVFQRIPPVEGGLLCYLVTCAKGSVAAARCQGRAEKAAWDGPSARAGERRSRRPAAGRGPVRVRWGAA